MLKFSTIVLGLSILSNSSIWGQTWTQIPSGTTKNLTAISFPSNSVGYIGGADSLLLKTVDGGLTWFPITYAGITFLPNGDDIVDLKFVSDEIGFLSVGPYTGTYKTIDGGTTWTAIDNIYACYNSGLYFFDENNGFLGGSGCFSGEIINKLDNGTWIETNVNPLFIPVNGMINNYDFNTTSMGLATSTGDYFFRTVDGGNTWDTIPNTLTSSDTLTSVLFVNNSTVLATYLHDQSAEYGVLISTDTGLSWQVDMSFATFFYSRMYATEKAGNSTIYVAGENSLTVGGINPGLIFESDGSITNWTYESVAESIRDIDSYGDSVVFAVGENGYIVVNQNVSQLGILNQKSNLNFTLFPNPNYGEFTLDLGENSIDKIEILDLQGRIVYSSDTNSNEIILSNFNAGIYQVKVQSNDKFGVKQVVVL